MIDEDELDQFWFLQNQYNANKRAEDDRLEDLNEDSDELSSSNVSSSLYRRQPLDPNEGAFEGIMSIRDDPRRQG